MTMMDVPAEESAAGALRREFIAVGLKELSRRWWRFGIKELSLQHIKIIRYE